MTGSIQRRMRRATALALATLAAALLVAQPADDAFAVDPVLPAFSYAANIVDPATQLYNPTGEFVFPTIFHAGAYYESPLGEWYLYYGPHDKPGGIVMMYADSLDGPWTQYSATPVIQVSLIPGTDPTHVAAADAFWNAQEQLLYVYFHGENSMTRWATSTDGLNFTYGGVAVSTAQLDSTSREVSYARVFNHPKPSLGNRYGMFFMENTTANSRRIRLALSNDGRLWTVQPNIVVAPGSGDGGNVTAGTLQNFGGQNYIVYSTSTGKIIARTIDSTLSVIGAPRLLYGYGAGAPSTARVAAPEFVNDQGSTYLFYEAGPRLDATIAYAKAPLVDLARLSCAGAGSDDFNGSALSATTWPTVVRPSLARHSVGQGALSIPTYDAGVAGAPLIQQPVRTGAWEATTAVAVSPSSSYQQAGLLLWASDSTYAKVDLGYGSRGLVIDYIQRKSGNDRNIWMTDSIPAPEGLGDRLWLRMTSTGTQVTASYSINGTTFTTIGRPVLLSNVPATRIGPYALRGATTNPEITGVFDWFQWKPAATEAAAC